MTDLVKVEYTEALPVRRSSSLVDGIYFNANENSVVFDLNDRIYKYTGVSRGDAVNVATAASAGSAYQSFKRKFGPGTFLGDYEDVDWEKVDSEPTTFDAHNLSVGLVNASSVTSTKFTLNDTDSGKEYFTHKVGFVVVEDYGDTGSVSELKHHTMTATSVSDVLEKFSELGQLLGLNFVVKEVTVYFD